MTTSEVCELARFSRATLANRIAAGKMPAPIDRGRENLFETRAVYRALGIDHPLNAKTEEENPWLLGAIRFGENERKRQAEKLRRREERTAEKSRLIEKRALAAPPATKKRKRP
jgi:hypothetical protein